MKLTAKNVRSIEAIKQSIMMYSDGSIYPYIVGMIQGHIENGNSTDGYKVQAVKNILAAQAEIEAERKANRLAK